MFHTYVTVNIRKRFCFHGKEIERQLKRIPLGDSFFPYLSDKEHEIQEIRHF